MVCSIPLFWRTNYVQRHCRLLFLNINLFLKFFCTVIVYETSYFTLLLFLITYKAVTSTYWDLSFLKFFGQIIKRFFILKIISSYKKMLKKHTSIFFILWLVTASTKKWTHPIRLNKLYLCRASNRVLTENNHE